MVTLSVVLPVSGLMDLCGPLVVSVTPPMSGLREYRGPEIGDPLLWEKKMRTTEVRDRPCSRGTESDPLYIGPSG